MLFIFGWNHIKTMEYGPVQEEYCANCHNKDIWQLKKLSRSFTIFFIPVFSYDSENFYYCPICNHGLRPDMERFKAYKEIARINIDCLKNVITEEERESKIQVIKKTLREQDENESLNNNINSSKWAQLVAEKTTEELEIILNQKRTEYNPAFIIAAENELSRRKQN